MATPPSGAPPPTRGRSRAHRPAAGRLRAAPRAHGAPRAAPPRRGRRDAARPAPPPGARGAAASTNAPLPRLPVHRVLSAPAAVLAQLDAVWRVALRLVRLVIA